MALEDIRADVNSNVSHASVIDRILKRFNPTDYGLSQDFLLTKMTQMKGCGCKVPRNVLLELLKSFGESTPLDEEVGIGLDSCVIPLRHPGLRLVQTTDFFYPLIDDPYIMGHITAANVLSDLYAMGVSECDNMLMLLGVCTQLHENERDLIVTQFINGFKDAATLADTAVRGGQTVRCPWMLLGGVASSVCSDQEILRVDQAQPGDVLVLTKPLGGQVCVNSYEWLQKKTGRVEEMHLDGSKIIRAAQQAMEQMTRLNRNAARCVRKHGAHASTDVTGFGILGHADNLARAQSSNVRFIIDTLPIIEYMDEIARAMNGNGFNLFGGTSAETSGGLLVALPPSSVDAFRNELESLDGFPTWIVGRVVDAQEGEVKGAMISPQYTVLTVPSQIH